MPTTPAWQPALNGATSNLNATNHAAQIDQLLGTHNVTSVYSGARIVTPGGGQSFSYVSYGNVSDISQPFTMPVGHTVVGRITLPLSIVNNGADLLVSLCPDNGAGSPNTAQPLASTMVPASWISEVTAPTISATTNPLATARFNTWYLTNKVRVPWAPPSSGIYGAASSGSGVQSGNFFIVAGGSVTSGAVADVSTTQYIGPGVVELPVPQPALPIGTFLGSIATTSNAVIYCGGLTGSGAGTPTTATWTASWDPNTGVIGNWSSQTALPEAISLGAATTYNNTIYVIGGATATSQALTTVYQANIDNGQITSWLVGPPLPSAINYGSAAVIGNWLIVFGGENASLAPVATTYYAPINRDGTLGTWRVGPNMPIATSPSIMGSNIATTYNAVLNVAAAALGPVSDYVQTVGVTATGLADQWYYSEKDDGSTLYEGGQCGAFNNGDGTWELVNVDFFDQFYETMTLLPVTMMSIPLPVSGLTPGSTYHIVLQQHLTSDTSSSLSYGLINAVSGTPADALAAFRHSDVWLPIQPGFGIPISIFDNTPGGPILHTWQDPSSTGSASTSNLASRSNMMISNQYNLPIGVCEATIEPNGPLNSNPTFTSGTSPWVAHNCTLTQSSAQVHGGYTFSGLLTPTGSNPSAYVESEQVPILAKFPLFSNAQWYTVNGWLYSTTGWANVSLSVNWYDHNGAYISTSSNVQALAAATWTNVVNYYQAPSNAQFGTIVSIESGTPGATNLLYLSDVTIALSLEANPVGSSVSRITYGSIPYPPTGIVQVV